MSRGATKQKEKTCKQCGGVFMGKGRTDRCNSCKYTCPDCGKPKKYALSTWCYECSLRHRRIPERTITPEQQAKMHSPEAMAKIKAKLMGHSVSEETREKIRKMALRSPERRAINVANGQHMGSCGKGRPKSENFKRLISERTRGEKNHMWKDGASGERGKNRDHKAYIELQEQIRERDNYTCQVCGKKQSECSRKLDVHHIDDNKNNHDPNNLEALCHGCHQRKTIEGVKKWRLHSLATLTK